MNRNHEINLIGWLLAGFQQQKKVTARMISLASIQLNSANEQTNKQTSKQASANESKQERKQARLQVSKNASKQASRHPGNASVNEQECK